MTALERMAYALCRESGYDPDLGAPEEYHWSEWLPEARAALNALRDTEYPGLLSLGMNELVDAILNETPE